MPRSSYADGGDHGDDRDVRDADDAFVALSLVCIWYTGLVHLN